MILINEGTLRSKWQISRQIFINVSDIKRREICCTSEMAANLNFIKPGDHNRPVFPSNVLLPIKMNSEKKNPLNDGNKFRVSLKF